MEKLSLKKEYNKYSAYKNIKIVENLDIPQEWDMKKITTIGSLSREKGGEGELLSVYLDRGVIKASEGSLGTHAPKDDLSGYQSVRKGDFILNNQQAWRGSVGVSELNGLISPAYIIFRFNDSVFPRYYNYLCRSNIVIDQFRLLSKGVGNIQRQIHASALKSTKVIIPSEEEQEKIADFLDEKIASIDSIIEKKKILIEKLKEKRSAVINHAVTKGLDPKAKLVDSGVEWIGEVPKNWSINRIKSLSQVKRGASPRPIDDQKYFDENGEYAWVRISDVTASYKYLTDTTQNLSELGSLHSVRLNPGELIVSIAATVGKPVINKIKCCIHDGFVYLKNLELEPEFLFYVFDAGNAYKGLGKLGTQLNLNSSSIGNVVTPVPSEEEQAEIAKFLSKKDDEFRTAILKTEDSINSLQEFKSSLISHAVTGKIKI